MQDRFRYRVFDSDDKKMHDVIFLNYENNSVEWYNDNNKKRATFIEEVPTLQCTGLKDKNGKDIYEGDIIQTTFDDNSKVIFYVVWNDGNALFNGKIIKKETNAFCINEDYLYYLLANGIDEKTEILGNIYENPELLENKQ